MFSRVVLNRGLLHGSRLMAQRSSNLMSRTGRTFSQKSMPSQTQNSSGKWRQVGTFTASKSLSTLPWQSSSNVLSNMSISAFGNSVRRMAHTAVHQQGLTKQAKIGWAVAGGAALLSILAMGGDGLAQQNKISQVGSDTIVGDAWDTVSSSTAVGSQDVQMMPAYVRDRLASTYSYVLGGLGLTAASAAAFFRSGIYIRGLGGALAAMAGTMVAMYATQAIPKENVLLKHAAWSAFNASIGLTLVPIAALGGPLVMRAALLTAGVVGGVSTVAATAPSETFLWTRGPLSIGLGIVFASSIGSMFFPASALLQNIWLYGGLAVFGGFVLYDTSRMIKHAEELPDQLYDPINQGIGLYMNTVNIFIRIAMMLSGSSNNRRR